ncbi:MAG: cytochrome c3 family protein [Proteobacteria bacterium]|nr:cytochrome c3 family protein [Pseudomonadota bacterium]
MKSEKWPRAIFLYCLTAAVFACAGAEKTSDKSLITQAPLPYKPIAKGGDDPGERGPDDSTVLNTIETKSGEVPFTHFTHASNSEKGYKIPCRKCHHATPKGEDPLETCSDCHEPFKKGSDAAHLGPDDNLLLSGKNKTVKHVPFNHFTHASNAGYKIKCDKCHHKAGQSGYGACTSCHGEIAKVDNEGEVIPKAKRAFHLQCKGCHESLKKRRPESPAPIDCKACHTEKSPSRLGGHLTLERAYHLMCIDCHQKLEKAKAPTRECSSCHKGGVKVDLTAHFAIEQAEQKERPKTPEVQI